MKPENAVPFDLFDDDGPDQSEPPRDDDRTEIDDSLLDLIAKTDWKECISVPQETTVPEFSWRWPPVRANSPF